MRMKLTPEEYVNGLLTEDGTLARISANMEALGMPDIAVEPAYGRLLTLLVRMSGAKRVLEVGALGGYSGVCLCRGLGPDGRLTSLELREDYAAIARRHLAEAGFGDRAEVIAGDAGDTMRRLAAEGRTFDFFFLDADKASYPQYLELAIRLAVPGAVLVADNTLLGGRVCDPERNGPSVVAMRAFNEAVASDERLMGTLLPAYDGLAVAIVR
jgi:predicted O-methyltransferase YrrM